MAKERFIHFTVRQAGADDAETISRIGGMTFASAYGAIVRPERIPGTVYLIPIRPSAKAGGFFFSCIEEPLRCWFARSAT